MTQSHLSASLSRERIALQVRFKLRFGQTTGEQPRQLYIRLTVDRMTCSEYTSGVYVRPDQWDSKSQKVLGSSQLALEVNHELETIQAEHKNLTAELMRLHQAGVVPTIPSANLIKQHWTRKKTLIPTLLEAFDTQLTYLRSLEGTPDAREKKTLDKWRNGRTYLMEYITQQKAEGLTADLLTRKWAEGFYHFLLRRSLIKATAARFVGYLRASINYLVDIQKVGSNPIGNYFPDKGKDKPIYFMEQQHLDKLRALEDDDSLLGLSRDWLLLMCYTGMDQPDLERYVASPDQYHEETEAGVLISIARGKTDQMACIPFLPQVSQILAKYPSGIPNISNQVINRYTWIIEKQIGFKRRLTTKICRKTAGSIFLILGYRIEEVSKILGHSSMQTTLRHYVKTTGAMVKVGMVRVQGPEPKQPEPQPPQSTPVHTEPTTTEPRGGEIRQPFLHIYKAG